jgi:ribose-phosphate pyrophosphokinase
LLAGSAHPQLAAAVARELQVPLGACQVARFPDGEVSIQIEQSVRAHTVLVLQPTGPPVNDNFVELLAFVDACRRAAAGHVIAIVPYFGYARSDRRRARREPIGASMVAAALEAAGLQQVVTVDIHSPAIEGFFRVPFDNLNALPILAQALAPHATPESVVVAPDLGRARAAAELAGLLGCSVAVVHKRRTSGASVEALQLAGAVEDRPCLLLDDMISTGGTVVACVQALERAGARSSGIVAATHGVFSDGALQRLADAGITRVYVTDSLPPAAAPPLRLDVLSCAPLLAKAIERILNGASLADLT